MRLRDEAMHGLGAGTTHEMRSVLTGVFLPVWRCRAYNLTEKVNIWRGLAFSRRYLWDQFLRTDLTEDLTQLDLPVYFFVGRHDMTADPVLARAYFDRIVAPLKGYYTFEASAHSPLFEEPDRALDILLTDVTKGTAALADPS
jgi:pimeloyl-ACP methyl ester carboxylesterase